MSFQLFWLARPGAHKAENLRCEGVANTPGASSKPGSRLRDELIRPAGVINKGGTTRRRERRPHDEFAFCCAARPRFLFSRRELGEVVRALLDRGTSPFQRNKDCDPLYAACWEGRPEVVRLLLDRGALTAPSTDTPGRRGYGDSAP